MTQYFTRDLRLKKLVTPQMLEYYGAKGDGSNEPTPIQAAFDAALAGGFSLDITAGKNFRTDTGVTVNGIVSLTGTGILSTTGNVALINYNVNTTTVSGWYINGPTFSGPVTTNSASCALRFTGDDTAFIQYGYINCTSKNFNAFVKDEKTAISTANGLEGMLDWNTWNVRVLSPKTYGFWYTQGSGTGSNYRGAIVPNDASSAAFFFDGNGCVVGDVIFSGLQLGCNTAGGIGIKIGDSTKYRAQWDFSGIQFDANCDIPVLMSSTGAVTYKNWNMTGVNWGGATDLGGNVQPMYGSMIDDRDASEWKAGATKSTNTVGAISIDCFDVDFASWGAGIYDVYINGLVGGVDSCGSYYQFQIREASGSLTVVTNVSSLGVVNGFVASVGTSGTTATITVTCTSAAVDTHFNATVVAHGDGFKITRL